MLLKVHHTLALNGNLVEPGVYPVEQLRGADVPHLLEIKAAEPYGASSWETLLPDDPTKEELIGEIARLQSILEQQAGEIERITLSARESARSVPPSSVAPSQRIDPAVGRPPPFRGTGLPEPSQKPVPRFDRPATGGRGEDVVGFPNQPQPPLTTPAAATTGPTPQPPGDRPPTIKAPDVQKGAERRTK